MPLTFTQKDVATSCGPQPSCSGGAVGTNTIDREMEDGATGGSTEVTADIGGSTSNLTLFFQSTALNELVWESGTWTVRLNVTTGNMDLSLEGIWICREDSSCSTVATIGSDTSMSTQLDAGTYSWNISGVATDDTDGGSETDTVYIAMEVANSHMNARTLGITPDQTIDSPIESSATASATAQSGTGTGTSAAGLKEIAGTATYAADGTNAENATILVTDVANEDPVAETTVAADGTFSTTVPANAEVHVAIQHDDGTDQFNDESYPYVS